MRDSVGIDETDLAVIHAVERSPRASWAAIGAAVGIDATTAARRWERLARTGSAWVTCFPLVTRTVTSAIVELVCAAGTAGRVAGLIARDPHAQFVDLITGSSDILVTVVTSEMSALSAYVLQRLGAIPGVVSVRTHPILTVYAEGNLVGAGTLSSAGMNLLPAVDHGRLTGTSREAVDDLDWEICLALSRDGRQSLKDLATSLETSEATVRRRLNRLTRLGAYRPMVEVASAQTSAPLTAWYLARLPARFMDATAAAVAALPNIKAVTSVAGPDNMVFKATFHDLAHVNTFDSHLSERFPYVEITDRKLVLLPVRLMSRIVDPQGFARETVSIDIRTQPPGVCPA
jgi:DNA-binding Lrp family transcriptional regulator